MCLCVGSESILVDYICLVSDWVDLYRGGIVISFCFLIESLDVVLLKSIFFVSGVVLVFFVLRVYG